MEFSPRRALLVLALVAASVVSVEVLLTRLLSVTTWYGLAFVVLSLAMLGLTSGSLEALRAREQGEPLVPWLARKLLVMSAGLLVATAVCVCIPVVFAPDLTSFASLLLVAGSSSLPLIAGGAIVGRLLAEAPVPVARLYAVDLVAAAAGALLPLALLGPLSAPAALVALAGALALASMALARGEARGVARALALVCVAVVLVSRGTSAGLVTRYPKGAVLSPDEVPSFEAWNALSHVRLGPFGPFPYNRMWSPSPVTPDGWLVAAEARIDGEAATPVYQYRSPAQLNHLRFDATTIAHALRHQGEACVIGVGGGRDLIAALVYGHSVVYGAEINPAMVAMLRHVSHRSPILDDPRVRVVVGDGRATFARTRVHCEVLQASLVDTWAATSAGAFAHTEATLYTREAWGIFLRRVAPRGVLTFSRWYDPQQVSETSRLVALAVAALRDRGVSRPRDHIALVAAGTVATVLVSPAPLSPEDLATLRDLEQRLRFTVLIAPDHRSATALFETLLDAPDDGALAAAGAPFFLDTSPPTDDRPFFFQLMAPRVWLHPRVALQHARGGAGVLAGNAMAMFELLVTFLAVGLLGAALLGPTLARAARAERPSLPGARAGVYFAALGAGFMTAEIALVQRMHVVLGHPTLALVVVLAGLLVATGLGSALSPRVVRSRRGASLVAAGAGVLLIALPWVVISPLARATMDARFEVRCAWTGGAAALVGLLLGMLFPSGLRYLARAEGAPVALALNGATSVLGSVLAVTVSVWAGIPATFAVAGAIYLLAALAGPHGWRHAEPEP
ncbi:MAG: hypothetical protein HY909_09110 [Deltaproteobacteria bacterium]|nr:hypothetical protein [Deltaproteobacteria bacterium]